MYGYYYNGKPSSNLVPKELKEFISDQQRKSKSKLHFAGKVLAVAAVAGGVVFALYKYLTPDYEEETVVDDAEEKTDL